LQRSQKHVAVRDFKLLFPQRDLYQLVVRTKQRPCVGHILILMELILNGLGFLKRAAATLFVLDFGMNGLAAASRIALPQ
jgi:hypothetical protein